MNDTDIRERDIDSSATFLLSGFPQHTPQQWRQSAAQNHGRTRDVYARCAEITAARQALSSL